MAERTGLEPAASGVTGRRYNQLNYRSVVTFSETLVRNLPLAVGQGLVMSFRGLPHGGSEQFICLNLPLSWAVYYIKTMPLVVTGSIGLDSIETPTDRVEKIVGGSCTYFAAAASFFGPVRLVGAVGGDFSDDNKSVFSRFSGVCTEGLEIRPKSKTFAWGCRYQKNMNERQTLFTDLGVLEESPPAVPPKYRDSEFVFLANTHPKVQLGFLEQFPKKKLVVADTMNLWINIAKDELLDVISKIDGLMMNAEEAELLTGKMHPITAGKKILQMGPKFVVIKRGEFGSVLIHKDGFSFLPAYPTEKVVDPTGCGDTFAGAFMSFLANTRGPHLDVVKKLNMPVYNSNQPSFDDIRVGLLFGTLVASLTIESMGLRRLEESKFEDIQRRFEEFYPMIRI
jgi:sugar/nucleoside kinase (ribokinase family)